MGEWNQLYFCKLLNMTSLTCDNLIFLFLAYRFYPVYYEPNFCLHLHAGYPCAPVPSFGGAFGKIIKIQQSAYGTPPRVAFDQ